MKKIVTIWLALLMALSLLAGCRQQPEATDPPPAATENPTNAPEDDKDDNKPVTGEALQNGSYPIAVESSSSMFRIVDARLTVEDGKMSALLTLSGTGYQCLFMGTSAEAAAASEQDTINFVENAEGKYTYAVPVDALNQDIDCAAFSIRKETWYDRVLVFDAASLPAEAWKNAPTSDALADGNYTAEVTLTGGSGRSTVTSPARLTVKEGHILATIEWSSPNYDYMRVDGTKYDPVNQEGNAVFEIPVAGLDQDIAVVADTTAMSQPHEVDYTLHFSSASLEQSPS